MTSASFTEFREKKAPIVRYRDGRVSELEGFYDLPKVSFRGIRIFEEDGADVLRKLEALNGSAEISVGIVLFDTLGVTTGRMDEEARTDHSITAFAGGLWDEKRSKFSKISF
ncbi:hypothetical protein [Aureimonas psammosilenae]|uniref:hypothetical protein n=1 Tax=Aureimonas psammosilenae TaxID=2495496 RepID=UPI001260902A|nr:hypothetical protein [Aureimonas psammosilenae]